MWTRDGSAQPARQRGVATVEFAIVAPLLVLLMLAVTELGWAFHQYNVLTKAVRDGARYASANWYPGPLGYIALSSTAVSNTAKVVVYGNEAGLGTPVLPNLTTSAVSVTSGGSTYVTVTANYAFEPMVTSLLPNGTALNFNLSASSTVRGL